MAADELKEQLGPELARAFAGKGYDSLTSVQAAVLAPGVSGRDLRMSSQTGSGKTVALGLAIRDVVRKPDGKPRALVIAPTRELAKQVEEELSWLFEPLGATTVSVTGGTSVRDERRDLSRGPTVVVGTPGRLLDHLTRAAIDPSGVRAVVLDEADRLLDMGFREDLEAILAFVPEGRRTHLVSATFPREVQALANKVQSDPVSVEGTALGVANADIEHVIHLVDQRERTAALINLLLAWPDAQTLVFARTRADVARVASELDEAGFSVRPLSGEMQQRERERALNAFRRGELDALIATDVAARGIDVVDIARVIQLEPPTDSDTYTHRSGRTGRAGRKGQAVTLVSLPGLARLRFMMKRAGVIETIKPVPTAQEIREARSQHLYEDLTAPLPEGFAGFDDATYAVAKRLATGPDVARTITRLLLRARAAGVAEPRHIRPIRPPEEAPKRTAAPTRETRGPREAVVRGEARSPRDAVREPSVPREPSGPRPANQKFVTFQVSWGAEHGADPRRLFALICRRGEIDRNQVGAIRIGARSSTVEVSTDAAEEFEKKAQRPDARDARVRVRRMPDERPLGGDEPPRRAPPPRRK
jgi:ATP-dependent RNA helicase DeaD